MTAAPVTTPTPVATRRGPALWAMVLAAAVLVGLMAVSGARLTWEVPIVTVQADRVSPQVSDATVAQAARLAAARRQLTALRQVANDVPSIGQGLHDEIQLLAAVGVGHVPPQALEADSSQLEAAVNAGLVPREALDPME
jgi:hypothetical protein